jgi:hypothetical protein
VATVANLIAALTGSNGVVERTRHRNADQRERENAAGTIVDP